MAPPSAHSVGQTETRDALNQPLAPPPDPPVKAPPPAQWLRGAGLVVLLAFIALDALDRQLSASLWAYGGAIVVILWGPEILIAAPDIVRAIFRRP